MDKTTQNTDDQSLSKFKTKPLNHQLHCLNNYGRRKAFALNSEQGTGKTWIIINNIADLWSTHDCDAVLVMAPNGVHLNWTRIEIPKHMPDWVRYRAASWTANPNKQQKKAIENLYDTDDTTELRIFTMNWEALQTKRGQEAAERFAMTCRKLMIVGDEAGAMKNPSAQRTAVMMKLKKFSEWRRTMDGTPVSNSPFDLFAPFNFLDETILGTTSFYAFKAEYAELLDEHHPMMVSIKRKTNSRFTPQVVAKGRDGRPRYRNLDKLEKLIRPHMFRILKSECLDLPEKVYKTILFQMTPEQEKVYKLASEESRLEFADELASFDKLVANQKLSQITSGYYLHPDAEEPVRIPGDNPRMELLMEQIERVIAEGNKIIVWARYHVQIDDIVAQLKARKINYVEYHGRVKKADRPAAIDAFEHGEASVFVGQQQAGGTGITLIAASYVAYFSNTYSLRDRLQSEDRAHRIGQKKTVVYYDFAAIDTIDEEIIQSLTIKGEVADTILDKGVAFALKPQQNKGAF